MSSPVETAIGRRRRPGLALAEAAEKIARASHDMAVRFHQGGTLIAFDNGDAVSDAAQLAAEFVHPGIGSGRALPAVALANGPAAPAGTAHAGKASTFADQIRLLGRPDDIAVGIATGEPAPQLHAGLAAARDLGMLTVALSAGPAVADHVLQAATHDPLIANEIHITTYHLLWELVHMCLARPTLLEVSL